MGGIGIMGLGVWGNWDWGGLAKKGPSVWRLQSVEGGQNIINLGINCLLVLQ